jgi:alanine racemase
MDMIMVNVTSIECQEGDEVILFDQTHSACEFAEGAGTISYELITALGPRVNRIVKQ